MYQRGFTMIEIMVVIMIIGVLGAVGFGSYTKTLAKSNNSKAVQDMKAVQKGFELYYSTNGYNYTATADCSPIFSDVRYFPTKKKPVSPKASMGYSYNCTLNTYCICAQLDSKDYKTGNSNAAADGTCSGLGNAPTAGASYYCVKNQQ